MTVTINGTTGVTAPEVTLDNSSADGGQVVLKSSGYSNWNVDNYNGKLRAYYGATEFFTVNQSGDLYFNSGYGSIAVGYGCRAWVNFNGTGTVAIRASGNVSSITDNGIGNWLINFSQSLPDANYSVVGSTSYPSWGVNAQADIYTSTYSASAAAIVLVHPYSSFYDGDLIMAAVFR